MEDCYLMSELLDKISVVVGESSKSSEISFVFGFWETDNSFDLLGVGADSFSINNESKKFYFVAADGAFGGLEEKTILSETLEDLLENIEMLLESFGVYGNIIHKN